LFFLVLAGLFFAVLLASRNARWQKEAFAEPEN
jgi:hypothetical protein